MWQTIEASVDLGSVETFILNSCGDELQRICDTLAIDVDAHPWLASSPALHPAAIPSRLSAPGTRPSFIAPPPRAAARPTEVNMAAR